MRHADHGRVGHKVEQLCAEAAEVLDLAFGESRNPRIQQLDVRQVVSEGNRLVVIVVAPDSATLDELDSYWLALQDAKGWLRSQLATEINRKRVPDLEFRVVHPSDPVLGSVG